jgi:hypothetical protein
MLYSTDSGLNGRTLGCTPLPDIRVSVRVRVVI